MRAFITSIFIISILLFAGYHQVSAQADKTAAYRIENIATPEDLFAETGAIDFLPDGRLIACFLRGEVMIYNTRDKTWKLFAEGLHEPLGISVISDSEILVIQRPELTRLKDTNGDGQADLYETVNDDFGISGNYHEYNYGPLKDSKGNYFLGLNTGSYAGRVMKEYRGKRDTIGHAYKGQMFSPVSYRGWIMQLTPKGQLIPYASGLRSPNGLALDASDNLFVTDNQGDWVGTSPLYHIQKGRFYGHPASLVWEKNWAKGDPIQLPVEELDKMRTKASVLFPHNIIANSATQPIFDYTKGKFGPFSGQMFVGDMNTGRLVRVLLEKINGEFQGACLPFLDAQGLHKGNNRLAFAPDGSLWIGQAEHGWAGDKGIQRIVFTGKNPADILSMNLTETGFDISFTKKMDQASVSDSANYHFRQYYYEYHAKYGSDQFGLKNVPVSDIKVSADGLRVSISLASLTPGFVYELKLGDIKAADGDPLASKVICYTLNNLKK